jgi:hypothetical protein
MALPKDGSGTLEGDFALPANLLYKAIAARSRIAPMRVPINSPTIAPQIILPIAAPAIAVLLSRSPLFDAWLKK